MPVLKYLDTATGTYKPLMVPIGSGDNEVTVAGGTPVPVNNLPELWVDTAAAGISGIPMPPLALPAAVPFTDVGGAIPDNLGAPTYLDVNGLLRAANTLLTCDDGKFTNDTLNTQYPVGTSVLTVSSAASTSGGWPIAPASGIVLTIKRFDTVPLQGGTVQIWFSYNINPTGYRLLFRAGTYNAWGPWQQFGGLYSGQAANAATFNLTTTAVFDVASLTVPVVSTDSVYMVTSTMDLATLAATSATFLGGLSVGGTAQQGQIVWIPTTALLTGARMLFSQTYRMTGFAAGNVIFKTTCSCSVANQFRVASTHSMITVQQIA